MKTKTWKKRKTERKKERNRIVENRILNIRLRKQMVDQTGVGSRIQKKKYYII